MVFSALCGRACLPACALCMVVNQTFGFSDRELRRKPITKLVPARAWAYHVRKATARSKQQLRQRYGGGSLDDDDDDDDGEDEAEATLGPWGDEDGLRGSFDPSQTSADPTIAVAVASKTQPPPPGGGGGGKGGGGGGGKPGGGKISPQNSGEWGGAEGSGSSAVSSTRRAGRLLLSSVSYKHFDSELEAEQGGPEVDNDEGGCERQEADEKGKRGGLLTWHRMLAGWECCGPGWLAGWRVACSPHPDQGRGPAHLHPPGQQARGA